MLNIFKARDVYEWEDYPNEGKVIIISYEHTRDYILSDEAVAVCISKNKWFPQVRGDFIIRNMVLDFDGKYVQFNIYSGGETSDYEVEY